MSSQQKENIKYFFGALGAVGMFMFSTAVQEGIGSYKKQSEKIDQIYISSIKSDIVDSLQTLNHNLLQAKFNQHEKESNETMIQLMQSMLKAKIQLTEIDQQEKVSQDNQN